MAIGTSEKKDNGGTYHEVVIIGAGMTGLCQLHYLKREGIDALVLDANSDVGGTWYNNRYPGCRFDSESYTYGFSFSKEILDKWHWRERFSSQPENLRYTQFVTEELNLRENIEFDSRVKSAHFDDDNTIWNLTLENGKKIGCRYLVTGLGGLSAPTLPRIDGIDSFRGESFHTFNWPHAGVDLKGKRVGVIGSGSTGVQVISEIADKVGQLTVLQRRPNWCAPLKNGEITEDEMQEIRNRYDEIFSACAATSGGFIHAPDRRGFYNVSKEERLELWERLYDEPGFGVWLSNFTDIFVDEEANAEFSEFIAGKIRARVNDPKVAELLIPKDHGFGVQRVPLETNYYEAFNRDNVKLVSLQNEQIECVTETGIKTDKDEYELDLIVYATGFDALTGAFDRIDFRGVGGAKLTDKWANGPETYMGMFVSGFPNLITLVGPQSGSYSTNFPRAIETCVGWATDFLVDVRNKGKTRFEATAEAEQSWCDEATDAMSKLLLRKAKSWFNGFNSNIDGHDKHQPKPYVYVGGNPRLGKRLAEVRDDDYAGVEVS